MKKNVSFDEERKEFKVAHKAGIEKAPLKRKDLLFTGISEKVPREVLTHQ